MLNFAEQTGSSAVTVVWAYLLLSQFARFNNSGLGCSGTILPPPTPPVPPRFFSKKYAYHSTFRKLIFFSLASPSDRIEPKIMVEKWHFLNFARKSWTWCIIQVGQGPWRRRSLRSSAVRTFRLHRKGRRFDPGRGYSRCTCFVVPDRGERSPIK